MLVLIFSIFQILLFDIFFDTTHNLPPQDSKYLYISAPFQMFADIGVFCQISTTFFIFLFTKCCWIFAKERRRREKESKKRGETEMSDFSRPPPPTQSRHVREKACKKYYFSISVYRILSEYSIMLIEIPDDCRRSVNFPNIFRCDLTLLSNFAKSSRKRLVIARRDLWSVLKTRR